MTAKKSCKCGEYGSFEHLLFLFIKGEKGKKKRKEDRKKTQDKQYGERDGKTGGEKRREKNG